MKRVMAIVLILVMILPAAALADDPDPIIGSWYMLYDKSIVPELASSFQDYDLIVAVYSFMADGTIILTEGDIKDGTNTPHCGPTGKWGKDGSDYTYSIIGFGSGDAYIKDGEIHLKTQGGYYLKFRKMTPYNPYTDYVY